MVSFWYQRLDWLHLGMAACDGRLVATTFASGEDAAVERLASWLGAEWRRERRPFTGFLRELRAYLSGAPVRWRSPYRLLRGTPFQRGVWREIARIEHGRVRSYGEIACRLGSPRAARAVGAACGSNPLPIRIPCHRVVARGGGLGGFGGGLPLKRRLLAHEGGVSREAAPAVRAVC